jgi:hypothetical protein
MRRVMATIAARLEGLRTRYELGKLIGWKRAGELLAPGRFVRGIEESDDELRKRILSRPHPKHIDYVSTNRR